MSEAIPAIARPKLVRWTPDRAARPSPWPTPPMVETLLRGVRGRCPCCGQGHIFGRFLKVVPECSACHAPLGLIRADDLPPYLNIFIVGHIVVLGMLLLEQAASPPLWLHVAIWIPLTLALSFGLMQPIKGAVVGLMMKLDLIDQQPETLDP
jgi:uncharacterized protein (DUF983 family)